VARLTAKLIVLFASTDGHAVAPAEGDVVEVVELVEAGCEGVAQADPEVLPKI
jgi:hypothetical protein